MAYTIIISKQASKEIKQLPKEYISKVYQKIISLGEVPRPSGVVKLTSKQDLYRIRVGMYRVLYSIDDDIEIIDVRKIAHRKDIY